MSPRRPIEDIKRMNALFAAAEAAASRSGHDWPGAEHLVVAALDLPDGSARRALLRVGVDPDHFSDAVGVVRSDRKQPEPPGKGPLKTQKSAQKVFKRVAKLVRKERSQLYGGYLVLVAAADDEATRKALKDMGIKPEDLIEAARQELDALNV